MEKKKGKRKNTIALFFPHSLFAAANFWKRRVRAKQDLDTAVITHSPFISSDRYLFVLEAYFSRPPNPCRSSCIGPTPSTDEERQQSKMTSQAFPMIGSKVALAFHSGYRRPHNCCGVCTRGKIQNFFQFCESDEPSQRKGIACVSSEVPCCQLPSPPPSLSPSSLLPLPASTHTSYSSLHPSSSPSSHTPPPLSPPPTPAVHTLRTTKRWLLAPGALLRKLRCSPIIAFEAITTRSQNMARRGAQG